MHSRHHGEDANAIIWGRRGAVDRECSRLFLDFIYFLYMFGVGTLKNGLISVLGLNWTDSQVKLTVKVSKRVK